MSKTTHRMYLRSVVMGPHAMEVFSFSKGMMTHAIMAMFKSQRAITICLPQVMTHSPSMMLDRIHDTSPLALVLYML
ncbi:hypothetical protein [Brevibacillus porteri]|uniref:hypothetical protein n=1 Tax=Brevibacillus porteri TaxID=2126350 RepID=UPI003D1D62A5